ncbi:DNA polymerase IV [Virgibacillus halodenitrificans]|jgi:DNA polymerase IV|uniref:DNA polymerase IV n=1 Tax=Virgibacillus halodenitrificans TaxID=1482 RepID=A0AAC9J052_VIRHA|nr:DNA polymerase IV [Virgibacillus halodenitrificans]APC48364.1 DNA polymerase IV [Virgibacillus halodenitrificans]MCG1029853.1 DNA polymerase IV [Virgibacillus halodenitrificans]MCJ0930931.1 DNA polymerase IV [Virgibacillus halodenitrificans]MEC2160905.1 DNA polymerase IV [Virgibacillus halodenitrificans]WHX27428.1 DNA polymerase IV [Virgibacillus halodenitrificans]
MVVEHQNKRRVIFHIDMNCFYASVEMAYDSDLKGKALAIAGNPEERKGIIVTSSYEARAKGVKTTMPLWQARRLCPELVVLRPNFDRYRSASKAMFKILSEITPIVQPVSIDEGYMDVTDCGPPEKAIELAENIQNRILHELDLPCSIGIAPNKFLAKMASDMKKPMGITVLRKRELSTTLWPLPIEEMYGVGNKTAEKLKKMEIHTIGDLAKKDVYELKQVLGINGERLNNRANGNDKRSVDPDAIYDFKSIGSSQTLPHDTIEEEEIKKLMVILATNVERRLKRKQAVGQSIQLMIRYADRKTITRSKKLQMFIEDKEDILYFAKELLELHWNEEPIRLLGITVQDIQEKQRIAKQLDLFTYEKEAQNEKLYTAIDQLSQKYGKDVFKRWENSIRKEKENPTTSFQKDFLDDYKH